MTKSAIKEAVPCLVVSELNNEYLSQQELIGMLVVPVNINKWGIVTQSEGPWTGLFLNN